MIETHLINNRHLFHCQW